MGFYSLIFLCPAMNLPYLLVVSLVTAFIFRIGLKISKINPIINENENIKSETAWIAVRVGSLSGFSHGVFAAILWFASDIPPYYFSCISSEWGLQSTNDYISAIIFFLILNVLSSFSHYILCRKQKLTFNYADKAKKLFALTSITVGIIFWIFLTTVTFILNM